MNSSSPSAPTIATSSRCMVPPPIIIYTDDAKASPTFMQEIITPD